MSTTTTLRKLVPSKVQAAASSKIGLGGWCDPGKEHDKAHYMVQTGPPDDAGNVPARALCGIGEGTAHITELVPSDHLAPENCTACRRLVLEMQGLI